MAEAARECQRVAEPIRKKEKVAKAAGMRQGVAKAAKELSGRNRELPKPPSTLHVGGRPVAGCTRVDG
eukprot:365217-Chlamydomonas_euryale.AAC.2